MSKAQANANFYSLTGDSHESKNTKEYIEYRKSWEEFPEKFFLRDFPMHLDVEVTNLCNLRCTFCDKQPLLKNKKDFGYMEMNLFKSIIDEGAENRLWGLKLSYRGESLLHPQIVEMVDYSKKKGILDVYFNTNGMLLNESISKGFVEKGLDRISVSVEGIDPVVFAQSRIGANFETIKRNVANLIEIREKKNSIFPRVRMQTVLFPGTDLEEYKEYWKDYCDEVAAVDYKDESKKEHIIAEDWACPQLWQRMTIGWDGKIFMCNNDDNSTTDLGYYQNNNIKKIWLGEEMKIIRDAHKRGKSHQVASCDGCPWRTAQIKKDSSFWRN